MHEVVVEQDGELDVARRIRAALVGEKVQHVDRDDVGIGLLRDAVPVVQDVKALGARAAVEAGDHAIEENLLAAGAKAVGAHRIAQRRASDAPSVLARSGRRQSPANGPCRAVFTKPAGLRKRNFHSGY